MTLNDQIDYVTCTIHDIEEDGGVLLDLEDVKSLLEILQSMKNYKALLNNKNLEKC